MRLLLSSLFGLAAARAVHRCPAVRGDITVQVRDLFPESAVFVTATCKIYMSAAYNGTLVAWDPYINSSTVYDIPGITSTVTATYTPWHINGVDYDKKSGLLYISVASADAFTSTDTGDYAQANFTQPNRIVRFDPVAGEFVSEIPLEPVQSSFQARLGNLTNGFQDTAENTAGDAFSIGTFGNSIARVKRYSEAASLWWAPATYNISYGFGGIFAVKDKIVISDTHSGGLVTFNTKSKTPSPTYVPLQNLPANYKPMMADGLFAPAKYHNKIALWSDDYNGTSVYRSDDNWASARFLGLVPNSYAAALASSNALTVASFDIGHSIYVVTEFFQFTLPVTNHQTEFKLIDITDAVDALVGDDCET